MDGHSFQATGIMRHIQGGPKLFYPLFWLGTTCKLLFPEHGRNIPFKLTNTFLINTKGEEQIDWERAFYFSGKVRYFNALMSYDAKRDVIKDYLGEPSMLYSDLTFSVTSEGSLEIKSKKQRLVLGRIEIPLPRFLQGLTIVRESYNEKKQVFEIAVQVKNSLIGHVFSYEGEFTANEVE